LEEGQEALLFAKLLLPARTPPIQRKEATDKDRKKTVRESVARLCEWLLVPNGTTLQCNPVFKWFGLKISQSPVLCSREIPANNWVGISRNANNCLKYKNLTR
jgi:hypothetical protein